MSGRRAALVAALLVAPFIAYGAATVVVWDRLTLVSADCERKWGGNTPEAFEVPEEFHLDTRPWAMPSPVEVRIPSRDAGIELAGWWLPATGTETVEAAPAAIIVHGFAACRRDHDVLLPAGMLHRNGFSVLLIDLRDHGASTIEDGRFAGGTDEYRDVLGAWDWLRTEQRVPATSIGLVGISLGAATVLLAAGQEDGVAAVWADSSYADLESAIDAELTREGYPTILRFGGVLVARLISGDDIVSYGPLDAVERLDGRALYITHGTADARLSVEYGHRLEAAARAHAVLVEAWYVDRARHTEASKSEVGEYERRLVGFLTRSLATPAR
ncbi:MAG: alpha/beta fold hydrolase [Chloroflexi bacterium]|nr:alpha/beta fold hydrolase [Chloroflexota bacterium]